MNVSELKKLLDKYPDEMEVITTRCSDYEFYEENDLDVVEAVKNNGGWLMRGHSTMSEENKGNAKDYLLI